MADGAKIQGVLSFEFGYNTVRQQVTRLQVTIPTHVVIRVLKAETELLRDRVQHFSTLDNNLRTGSVAGNDPNLIRFSHAQLLHKCIFDDANMRSSDDAGLQQQRFRRTASSLRRFHPCAVSQCLCPDVPAILHALKRYARNCVVDLSNGIPVRLAYCSDSKRPAPGGVILFADLPGTCMKDENIFVLLHFIQSSYELSFFRSFRVTAGRKHNTYRYAALPGNPPYPAEPAFSAGGENR